MLNRTSISSYRVAQLSRWVGVVSMWLVCLTSVAQVRLHGHITDDQGRDMEMVHVRLRRGSIGTLSNFKGEYELNVPDSDTLRVIFTSLGYKRVERVVNTRAVTADAQGHRRLMLNLTMQENQAVIGDVEVVARRQNVNPDNMERLEIQNIEHMRSTSGNAVEDMIGTMAGVTMNNELSSQYSVRGGSFDENLVYVNGIEVYRPQLIASGQQEGLSFINPNMVGEVDFSTGGFSAAYGDKMSSVLDIAYRRPEAFEAQGSVSFMGASASLGQRARGFTQLHGLRYKRNASILSSLDTKGEYDPIFFDYQTYLTLRAGEKWDFSLLGNVAINDYRFVPESRQTEFGAANLGPNAGEEGSDTHSFKVYFDGQEKDRFGTYFGAVAANYKGWKNTQLSLMASAFLTDERVTYDIAGEYWLDEATSGGQTSLGVGSYMEHARNYLQASVMALTLRGQTQVGHNRLTYGVTLQREHIDDKIAEWERRDSSGYSLPVSPTHLRVISNLHSSYAGTSARVSAFVQDTYGWDAWNGRFLVQGGLRLSHWSFNGETLLSPRVSLRYTPSAHPGVLYRIATGLYYQSPFYKEYRQSYADDEGNTMVRMNSGIRSQRSVQVIVGSDVTFEALNRPFKFTAEGYYKAISHYVPYTVDNVQIRYAGENQGHAYVTGLDMKLYGAFVEHTDSWLSLSLMSGKETVAGITTPRPTEQRYGIGVFFSDYWPTNDAWRVYLRGVFNDGLPFYSPAGGRASGIFRTPAYKRIDLGATYLLDARHNRFMTRRAWRYVSEVSLGLDLFNLLDIANTNSYYWVTAVDNNQFAVPNYLTGRMISLSLGVKFGKARQ